jgi:translation elongation factor EF-Tu-like GTPase
MVPVVEARVTLLPELSRGRQGLSMGQYRPHIVLGPQSQRIAIRDGNRFVENYLGVMFVGGPDKIEPGDTAEAKLALIYAPEEPYTDVQPGATFTIREGSDIVGYGVILSRGQESFPLPLRRGAESASSQ